MNPQSPDSALDKRKALCVAHRLQGRFQPGSLAFYKAVTWFDQGTATRTCRVLSVTEDWMYCVDSGNTVYVDPHLMRESDLP